jgi:hypothetical protein
VIERRQRGVKEMGNDAKRMKRRGNGRMSR